MKKLTLPLLISMSLLVLSGCSDENEEAAPKELALQSTAVNIQTVSLGSIPLNTVVAGSIVSDQQAQISSRLVGFIKNFDVKVGSEVKQGSLLFSIDSTDVKSGILKAQSNYQQAQAALTDAKLDFNRFKKLYEEESVSKQQFDKINLQFKVAQERMIAAQTGLNQAKAQLKYANVKAPFDGVVVRKMATAGDLSSPGKPVLILENKKSLSVETQVSHRLFADLRLGDTAQVTIDGLNEPVTGTIYTMVSAADPKTRTHTVKLSLSDLDLSSLNSGAFARISFKRGERQTMILPKSAIITRSGIQGVFVVEDNISLFHMVRLGASIGDNIEIKAGVNLGDQVVISNNASLLNGDLLTISNQQSNQP